MSYTPSPRHRVHDPRHHTDVDAASPGDGQVLTWSAAAQRWQARDPQHPDLAAHDGLGLATQAELDAHKSGTDHAASKISVTPAGGIASTNVQSALEELDTEKASSGHNHAGVYEPAGSVAAHEGASDPHPGYVRASGAQTIVGPKTIQPDAVGGTALTIQALSGQTGNILEARHWSGALTGYMNEKGELRALPAAPNSVPFRVKQANGQTANLTEWANAANSQVLAHVGPNGELRSTAQIGTKHVGAATPSGGQSGDIVVGDDCIWVNDAGTWRRFARQSVFSVSVVLLAPSGGEQIAVWRAPFACTVLAVRGRRTGGTDAQVNARRNALSLLASALVLNQADQWISSTTIQNGSFAAGDELVIVVPSVAGGPSQVAVQVDLQR
jgi:hypothetical protein